MANVVDALIVTLGLDAKQFKSESKKIDKSLKETSDSASRTGDSVKQSSEKGAKGLGAIAAKSKQTGAEMERAGKQGANAYAKVRNEVLSLLAVFTAGMGIKNFVANTITGAASLGRMAQNLDMSTKDLTAWQRAAERAGGTAEGITGQLQESANAVGQFRLGQSNGGVQSFFAYGGKSEDLKDGNSYLLARSKIVADLYKTDKQRASVVAQQLGLDQAVFDLIKQGPDAINQLVESQRKRASVTAEDARKADELRKKFLDLKDGFTQVGTKVTLALIPAFERIIEWLERLAVWFDQHSDEVAQGVGSFIDKVIEFARVADKAAQSVGGWQNVLIALAGLKLASMTSGLLGVAGALVSVGGGLAKIGASAGAMKALGVLGLAFYSTGLNKGEDEELAGTRGMGPRITPQGSTDRGTASKAVAALMKMGWTREQAIGIAANLQQESNFDPEAVGDDGKAYGLAQWHPDRQAMFKKVFGKDIVGSSFEDQLQFIDWELRNSEKGAGDKLKGANTHGESAGIVSKFYERPLKQQEEMEKRAKLASYIYRDLGVSGAAKAINVTDMVNSWSARGDQRTGTSVDNSVRIDKMTVNTQATDANAMARDTQTAIQRHSFAAQANTGVN